MPVDLDAELEAERTHLATSRTALHAMRLHAEKMYAAGAVVAGDPFAAETLGVALARRVAELADDPRTPLFFGRLDLNHAAVHARDGSHQEALTGRFYIGRRLSPTISASRSFWIGGRR